MDHKFLFQIGIKHHQDPDYYQELLKVAIPHPQYHQVKVDKVGMLEMQEPLAILETQANAHLV
jgi:mannitol/fructose-specific phosphotransferase system IIA component (Ntr-type)